MRIVCAGLVLSAQACQSDSDTKPGPTEDAVAAACDLEKHNGILGLPAFTGPTAATGAVCAKDYECAQGQSCVSKVCTVNQTDDKLTGELTIDADGDYIVTVTGPADKGTDVGRTDTDDPIELAFSFSGAATRQTRLLGMQTRSLAIDPDAMAILHGRERAEPFLRALELKNAFTPLAHEGPARAICDATTKFAHRGACYSVGESFGPIKYTYGKKDITLIVSKIVGGTAILSDKNDTIEAAQIDKLADAFENVAKKRDLTIFNAGKGHTGDFDTDGNGLVGIVLSSKVGASGVAGIFDVRDILASSDGNGNAMDIVWAVPPGIKWGSENKTATFELVIGTLAHEYQHLLNFHRGKLKTLGQERAFLNEGLSHLAEDLSGYGASNISAVSQYLQAPQKTGLFVGLAGQDNGLDIPLRGINYLYLRYHFEKAKGFTVGTDGALTDKGGIAFIEKLMAAKTDGIDSLATAAGSAFSHFPSFFTTLAASGNPDAPLLQSDCRFNFNAPGIDPVTTQTTGIKLSDSARKDAYSNDRILAGYSFICDRELAAANNPDCRVYMSGGYSMLWQNVTKGTTLEVRTGSAFTVRLAAVKVK